MGACGDRLSHRVAWRLTNGAIPDGLQVLHECDTPACVNPAHLFLGTQADNLRDMHAKGRGQAGDRHWAKVKPERYQRGEARCQARLTEADVRTIRADYAGGTRLRDLARRYRYSEGSMHAVVNGTKWAHVSSPASRTRS